jgi:hypothetical protein
MNDKYISKRKSKKGPAGGPTSITRKDEDKTTLKKAILSGAKKGAVAGALTAANKAFRAALKDSKNKQTGAK